jgi:hypothetical protein
MFLCLIKTVFYAAFYLPSPPLSSYVAQAGGGREGGGGGGRTLGPLY